MKFLVFPFLYLFSLGLSFVFAYFIYSFNPEGKRFFRNLLRVKGVKLIAFSGGIAASSILLLLVITSGFNAIYLEILTPVALVSFLNAVKAEIVPRMFQEEHIPQKVTLREPEKDELPEDILKRFKWMDYSFSIIVRHTFYMQAKSKTRLNRNMWAQGYVSNGITGEVRAIANELMQIGRQFGSYEEVSLVLSFVQSAITYQSDGDEEWPKYPVETLYEGEGDCEDFSILGAAILKMMGYDAALLFLPEHVALGVAGADGITGDYVEHDGRHYYYCEMTGEGWQIGELPEKHKEEKIEVQIVPSASLEIKETNKSAKED